MSKPKEQPDVRVLKKATCPTISGRSKLTYDHLFISDKTGKPYTTIHKVWDRLRKDAGLPHLRLHDMRHAFASYLVSSGRTLYEVQQILGHSSPIVTQRYAHLSTESLQEATSAASDVITDAMPD